MDYIIKLLRFIRFTLELYLIRDYDGIMQGSEHENLKYINKVFIFGYVTFLKSRKDFDYNRFINEVKTFLDFKAQDN